MPRTGVWHLDESEVPRYVRRDSSFLEKHLETWIENNPVMLASDLKCWMARQMTLQDRSVLDLLGITHDGTWVVVELKPGPLAGGVVGQALHYFQQLAQLTNHELAERMRRRTPRGGDADEVLAQLDREPDARERDYRLIVAGIGNTELAESAASVMFQHGFSVPIQVVSFQAHLLPDGSRVLLREVEEDTTPTTVSTWSHDSVFAHAAENGVRQGLAEVHSTLEDRGYRSWLKKFGFNYNHNSRLQTLWVSSGPSVLHIGYLSGNFPDLYGVDEEQAKADLGENWVDLPPDQAIERITAWADIIDRYREQYRAQEREPINIETLGGEDGQLAKGDLGSP